MSPKHQLYDAVGQQFDVVSTVDHPYPSPPIHLLDGHHKLQETYGDRVLVLNWDVSFPLDRFYRYDLITDTGLLAKHPSLYHYTPETPYSLQALDEKPWELLPRCIECAVAAIQKRHHLADILVNGMAGRALEVLRIANEAGARSTVPWRYSAELLKGYYDKFDLPNLSDLIARRYHGYFASPLTRAWIPSCLTSVTGPLAFEQLKTRGVFKREPFRPVNSQHAAPAKLSDIADALANDSLLPSLDVFYWSLAVARIQHYGNDFEFFTRLSDATGDPTFRGLQLTRDEQDCRRFLKFDSDFGVLLDIDSTSIRHSRRPNAPVKLTRVTTFGSVWVALGEAALGHFRNYTAGGFTDARLSLNPAGFAFQTLNTPYSLPAAL